MEEKEEMTEEIEPTGTLLEHRIAQTKADIKEIDFKVTSLSEEAKSLRAQQVELTEVLAKLEG